MSAALGVIVKLSVSRSQTLTRSIAAVLSAEHKTTHIRQKSILFIYASWPHV